jgi:lysophospholipid acyltransferase (LPLAT)-like uncharacterized protein
MMIPFVAREVKRLCPEHNLMTLASKHGDGKFVGMVMEKFGLISILGSTQDKKHPSRGIDYRELRRLIDGLKNGNSLGITPDGPRGPNQQINGELINIAKLTGAGIVAISYASSNFLVIKKSWDKFKFPLPFGKICFISDEVIYYASRDDEKQNDVMKNDLKNSLDVVQNIADQEVS